MLFEVIILEIGCCKFDELTGELSVLVVLSLRIVVPGVLLAVVVVNVRVDGGVSSLIGEEAFKWLFFTFCIVVNDGRDVLFMTI